MTNITIIGNLGRDPEVRTTAAGKKLVKLSVAHSFRGSDQAECTNWYEVTCFGMNADYAENYGLKGRLACVNGELKVRNYNKSDGTTGYALDVVANQLTFLDKPKDEHGTQAKKTDDLDPFADE